MPARNPYRKVKIGDIFVVPIEEDKLVVGMVLSLADIYKGTIMVGFYDQLFSAMTKISMQKLEGEFIATPNYISKAVLGRGEWEVMGNDLERAKGTQLPELRRVYDLYRGSQLVRHLTPEELSKYPPAKIMSRESVIHMLSQHFSKQLASD